MGKNKIKSKFNFNKKIVYIICGALSLTSLILFIVNGVKKSDNNYDYDQDEIKESLKDNQNKKDQEIKSTTFETFRPLGIVNIKCVRSLNGKS